MAHPEVWYALGRFIHQDFFHVYPEFCDGIRAFASQIAVVDRSALVEHLSFLVSPEFSDGQLAKACWDSGASFCVQTDQTRELLVELKQCLTTE